jgi:pilus assembly protein CpaC
VLVTAKSVGFTHLILWGETDKPLVIAVTCQRNLNDLRTQLKELFPDERIKVSSAGELVVLSGEVGDLRVPSRLAQVAKLHSEKLANLVEVSGNQQVQMEVRFAEVSRTGLRKIGLNFLWRDADRGYVGNLASAGTSARSFMDLPGTDDISGPPPVPIPAGGDAFNLIFSTGLTQFPFSTVLSILSQEGLAQILAEPTLVAMSGHEASFHAGGEMPILIAQQLGIPTVLGQRTISLKVYAEVSEPNSSNAVTLGGYQIPGFNTRNSETTVRLKDGQSFAIAGLLSDKVRSSVAKIPVFGDIPILGTLFRSKSFQREESELLVVVKAHLTQPLLVEETPHMPGEDEINHPSDFSFFLLTDIGGAKKDKDKEEKKEKRRRKKRSGTRETSPRAQAGGPLGPVGFMRE